MNSAIEIRMIDPEPRDFRHWSTSGIVNRRWGNLEMIGSRILT